MTGEVNKLKSEIFRLKMYVVVIATVLVVFVCMAAQPSTNPEVKTTSLIIVDSNGAEIARWGAEGIKTNALKMTDGANTYASITKDKSIFNRIAIWDSGGNERARWDTDSNGQPRFGLEDSSQHSRITLSVNADNPALVMSGPSNKPGFSVQMLGEAPALTLQDPITAARFGRIYTDPSGNLKAELVGRLTLSIRGNTYWSNPVPHGFQ